MKKNLDDLARSVDGVRIDYGNLKKKYISLQRQRNETEEIKKITGSLK